ncbi:MAG: hypothetical protein HYY04_15215 [Chloroflexi bacterium]|nr:hypothetical protein [Chloroflexota bacterium]
MMQRGHPLPEVSFVVRLWLERRELAGPPEWRFQVRHIQSGEQMHCRRLADLLAFVERQTGVPAPELLTAVKHDATGQDTDGHDTEEVQP